MTSVSSRRLIVGLLLLLLLALSALAPRALSGAVFAGNQTGNASPLLLAGGETGNGEPQLYA